MKKTAATYHVSLEGNDSNPGTQSRPFGSIARARDEVRTVNGDMTGDIVVYLHGGTYRIDDTIVFGAHDSGTSGYRVIYKAFPGENPVISGGRSIGGWQEQEEGLFKARARGETFRQLYVNGKRAVRARRPGKGEYCHIRRWDAEKQAIIVNSSDLPKDPQAKGLEMVVMMVWAEAYMRVASVEIDGEEAYVTPAEPERSVVFPRPFPMKWENQPYYFENSREFLDCEQHWYHDTAAGELWYRPWPGEDMAAAEVIAPMIETLIRIEGTLDHPVHHLRFEGLTFEHSTWVQPSREGRQQPVGITSRRGSVRYRCPQH